MILVADDEPAMLAALQLLFELNQLPVALARSPEEARQRVCSCDVRVIVQDMNFSPAETDGRSGVALFRELRRAAPVVLLTAWPSREAGERLLREGAAAYLAKPWDDEQLLGIVRRLLEGQANPGLETAPGPRR